jgi:hypothetical protein
MVLADDVHALVLVESEKVPAATEMLGFGDPAEDAHREASPDELVLIVRGIKSHVVCLSEGLFSPAGGRYRGILIGVRQGEG